MAAMSVPMAGSLLLRQVERRLASLKAVAQGCLIRAIRGWCSTPPSNCLRQRVFGLCQGYEDLDDHDQLRDDVASPDFVALVPKSTRG